MSRKNFFPSQNKKFQEKIILVPFWGGKLKNLQRHVDWLNEEGYDCVFVELKNDWIDAATHLVSSKNQFGLKHVWADQIEAAINENAGPKILFSFSNPSGSAIEAIARRHATDIKGLITDCGPSAQLWHSMMNLFVHETPLPFLPLRAAAAAATAFVWHPDFLKVIHRDLDVFPKGFRVLSIRGWKDPLITPKMIDAVFEPHAQIDWQKLSLPEGQHLNGLKDYPDEYKPGVIQFLKEISTLLK